MHPSYTSPPYQSLDDLFNEEEVKARAIPPDSPDRIATRTAKAKAEWDRGIALGWYNEDGTAGPNAEIEDDDEE